jgi:Family of unknown function (DUF6459)
MPRTPSQPPEAGRPGPPAQPGPVTRPRRPAPPGPPAQPGSPVPAGAGQTRRPACPREARRPLPDPAAVRLLAVPDSAPPYDDEALAAAASAERKAPARPGPARPGPGRGPHPEPPPDSAGSGGDDQDHGVTPGWPSLFAQVLAETLAGSRPPGQIVPWTTQRARSTIQRLGPTLSAGQPATRQRPLVRRVVTSRPSHDVLEMTVIVGFGPRIRALAVRLERSVPDNTAPPGTAAGRPARWLCTAVEAA